MQEIEELKQQLAEKDSFIADQAAELAQESANFRNLKEQYLRLVSEYDVCSKANNDKQQEIETQKQQIEALQITVTKAQDEVCVHNHHRPSTLVMGIL